MITDLKPKTSGSAPGFVGKLLGNRLALLNLAQGTYFNVITHSKSCRKPFYPILSPDFVSTWPKKIRTSSNSSSRPGLLLHGCATAPHDWLPLRWAPQASVSEISKRCCSWNVNDAEFVSLSCTWCDSLHCRPRFFKQLCERLHLIGIHAIEQRASSRSWYSELPRVADMYMLLHVPVGAHFQSLHVQIPSSIPFGEISETIPDLRRESQRFRDFLHYSHPPLKLLKLFLWFLILLFKDMCISEQTILQPATAWLAGLPGLQDCHPCSQNLFADDRG